MLGWIDAPLRLTIWIIRSRYSISAVVTLTELRVCSLGIERSAINLNLAIPEGALTSVFSAEDLEMEQSSYGTIETSRYVLFRLAQSYLDASWIRRTCQLECDDDRQRRQSSIRSFRGRRSLLSEVMSLTSGNITHNGQTRCGYHIFRIILLFYF